MWWRDARYRYINPHTWPGQLGPCQDKNLFGTLALRLVCLRQDCWADLVDSVDCVLSICRSAFRLDRSMLYTSTRRGRKVWGDTSMDRAKFLKYQGLHFLGLEICYLQRHRPIDIAIRYLWHQSLSLGSETLTSNVVFSFGIFISQCLLTEHRRVSWLCWFG